MEHTQKSPTPTDLWLSLPLHPGGGIGGGDNLQKILEPFRFLTEDRAPCPFETQHPISLGGLLWSGYPFLDANSQRRVLPRRHCTCLPPKGGNQVSALVLGAGFPLSTGMKIPLPIRNGTEHDHPPNGGPPPNGWPRKFVW